MVKVLMQAPVLGLQKRLSEEYMQPHSCSGVSEVTLIVWPISPISVKKSLGCCDDGWVLKKGCDPALTGKHVPVVILQHGNFTYHPHDAASYLSHWLLGWWGCFPVSEQWWRFETNAVFREDCTEACLRMHFFMDTLTYKLFENENQERPRKITKQPIYSVRSCSCPSSSFPRVCLLSGSWSCADGRSHGYT